MPTASVDGGFEGAYTNTQNPPRFNANLTLGTHLFDRWLTLGAMPAPGRIVWMAVTYRY